VIPLLRSELVQVPHGFTTREGGASAGPFHSLNLSFKVGDEPAAVQENGRRLQHAVGAPVACLNQVHGDAVVHATSARPDLGAIADADASWTQEPGLALGIGTADCLPILIHAPQARAVAAAHAGWRGTELQIGARAVEALVAHAGARPEELRAVLGPSIRRCCYEVSSDLAERFEALFGAGVVDRGAGKPHLDLALACRLTLERAGVPSESIEVMKACTHCDPEWFFSHRRDRGRTGRMVAFIRLD